MHLFGRFIVISESSGNKPATLTLNSLANGIDDAVDGFYENTHGVAYAIQREMLIQFDVIRWVNIY